MKPTLTRAEFLGLMAALAAWRRPVWAQPANASASSAARIARVIGDYDSQGIHRTATAVDDASAQWLARQAADAGAATELERFELNRVDVTAAFVQGGDRKAEGLPLFDGTFTSAEGIAGLLGPAGSTSPIVLTTLDAAGIQSEGRSIAALRRAPGTRAIVAITRGVHPGLNPTNAADFTAPYGAPVLQVSSEHESWLTEAAAAGRSVRVVASAARARAEGINVIARVTGERPELPPVVVITPRSGWWHCAGERGGGIACWLEAIRAAASDRAPRPAMFLASSGHELGHLGLEHFLHERPALIKEAAAWIHLGANIGAAGGAMRLQALDDAIAGMAVDALTRAGAALERQVPRGTVPAGEARNIHVGGGRYVSLLGTSRFFHSMADRFPAAVDVGAVSRYASAVADVLGQLRRAA